jgi:hypothetical protein
VVSDKWLVVSENGAKWRNREDLRQRRGGTEGEIRIKIKSKIKSKME